MEITPSRIIDPNVSGVPDTVKQYLIDIITGAQ